ncbi:glutamate receptor U1-like [Ornithodoros turicata]|uniref:glutamate receptor U1-like n=1 Tax=Ornithodoros turicata TaxID=34597 RepID=UPI003139BFB2
MRWLSTWLCTTLIMAGVVSLKARTYTGLADILRDFCTGGEVAVSWASETPHGFLALALKTLQSSGCVTVEGTLHALSRKGIKEHSRMMFPDSTILSKLLFLFHRLDDVRDFLAPAMNTLNSQVSMLCQVSFWDDSDVLSRPVDAFGELSCCTALLINEELGRRQTKYLVAQHRGGSGSWVRLWMARQCNVACSACGRAHRDGVWQLLESLDGAHMLVGTLHNPPHSRIRNVRKESCTGPERCFDGFEMSFMTALAQRFNFTFTLVVNPEGKFGGIERNRWSGMIGMVHRKEVDVALGGLSVFYERDKYVDFALPYIVDSFAFVTKSPRILPFAHAILRPFRIEVWFSALASLAVGTIVLRLQARWTQRRFRVGPTPNFWLLLATLVYQNGWRSWYETSSYKIFRGSWLILTVVLANAYNCVLLSVLSVPHYEEVVDTMEELEEAILERRMTAGTSNGTAQATFLLMSTSGVMLLIRRLMEKDRGLLVPSKSIGLQKAIAENYGYIDTRMGLVAAVADLNTTTVKVSNGHMINTYFSMAFHRYCFYRPQFEKTALRFIETGHFEKWLQNDAFNYFTRTEQEREGFSPLRPSDLVSAAVILFGGLGVAAIALTAEVLHYRCQVKKLRLRKKANVYKENFLHRRPLYYALQQRTSLTVLNSRSRKNTRR